MSFYPMLETGRSRIYGIDADLIVSFLQHPKSPHMVMNVFVCLAVHPEPVSQYFAAKVLGDVEEASDEMTKFILKWVIGMVREAVKQGGRVINGVLVLHPEPVSYPEEEVHLVGLA